MYTFSVVSTLACPSAEQRPFPEWLFVAPGGVRAPKGQPRGMRQVQRRAGRAYRPAQHVVRRDRVSSTRREHERVILGARCFQSARSLTAASHSGIWRRGAHSHSRFVERTKTKASALARGHGSNDTQTAYRVAAFQTFLSGRISTFGDRPLTWTWHSRAHCQHSRRPWSVESQHHLWLRRV